jgi:hypothetical protein
MNTGVQFEFWVNTALGAVLVYFLSLFALVNFLRVHRSELWKSLDSPWITNWQFANGLKLFSFIFFGFLKFRSDGELLFRVIAVQALLGFVLFVFFVMRP